MTVGCSPPRPIPRAHTARCAARLLAEVGECREARTYPWSRLAQSEAEVRHGPEKTSRWPYVAWRMEGSQHCSEVLHAAGREHDARRARSSGLNRPVVPKAQRTPRTDTSTPKNANAAQHLSCLRERFGKVGPGGVEPPTSRLSGVRSNHLSYEPLPVLVQSKKLAAPLLGQSAVDRVSLQPDPSSRRRLATAESRSHARLARENQPPRAHPPPVRPSTKP